jgi:3-phosphoshikimate 1-carboxyvinyltransferase
MTVEMMEAFGGTVERTDAGGYLVPPQCLQSRRIEIEGDHSSTSYHLAATAILGGHVRVRGLRRDSAQPDARFPGDLASLGCRVTDEGDGGFVLAASGRYPGFSWELTDAPDLAPTAAVLALFANGPCRLSGLGHLRFKESDRLAILKSNLARLGADVAVDGNALTIDVPSRTALHGARIDSAGDHRIAMAFGVAGLAIPGVEIDDPAVVAKSYPGYWEDVERLVRTGS